ncbi:HAD family hydrolase [Mangrovivirga sp. M17]|uniref:HAD family hydrolase n=1 Tax=Mangrovivirga halotolerans TaxID=2993936 RepID=A0ABT3RVR3_9BACT|nr:HAD family hydrolase [Mangrovivirga halotolerans]MCX2745856.1 HAD family hydrolase [Mangrovivirga halotolerans]
MEKNNRLALFDFDGTITTGDTFIPFIKYTKGKFEFLKGAILLSPYIILYSISAYPNWKLKEKFIRKYFKGMEISELEEYGQNFANEVLPGMIRPKAIEEINELNSLGYQLFIVTASHKSWILPWAENFDFQIISTEWEVEKGLITGKIKGLNCYGEEKKSRINKELDLNNFEHIVGYGDTDGDIPMLSLCKKTKFKPFR